MRALRLAVVLSIAAAQGGCGGDGGGSSPVTPAWEWRDAVIYQVEIDRFANGDVENDAPVASVETAANFQGGDLAGVLAKLQAGFFDDLGASVLCLSSVVDGAASSGVMADGHAWAGFQGLWTRDLASVDARFGTLAELQAVVAEAHARGLKVMLQHQLHHVHTSAPVYTQHADWFWPACVLGASCAWDTLPDRTRGWLRDFLPTLDHEVAAGADFTRSAALQWIADSGVDALWVRYAHFTDAAQLAALRADIAAGVETIRGEPFLVVGDVFTGDPAVISPYVATGTVLDGVLEYPLRTQLTEKVLLLQGSMADLGTYLEVSLGSWGTPTMLSFLGGPDLPRPISLAEGLWTDPWTPGEDRAWSGSPSLPAVRAPFERVANAWTVLLTLPGVPLLFYGDEIGLPGAGAPDNERAMQFSLLDANQTWLRERWKALVAIRAAHPALRRGTWTLLGADADVLTYRMQDGADVVFVAVNRSEATASATGLPEGTLVDLLGGPSVAGPSVVLAARSALVLAAP